MSAFDVLPPSAAAAPLIAHIPHASTVIPADLRQELTITDATLAFELSRLTDWYTDELFAGLTDLGATMFVNQLSRLVFDPERFLDDAMEPAAAMGQGVVYTHGSDGQRIRHDDPELRSRRIQELYRPYHAALDGLVGDMLAAHGTCTIIDCHSFPTAPLAVEVDRSADRPDICIGTDATHTPPELAAALEATFLAAGFRVARDAPYAGTFVPGGSYGRDDRVRSVMIEIRRGVYMDEDRVERGAGLATLARVIREAVAAAV